MMVHMSDQAAAISFGLAPDAAEQVQAWLNGFARRRAAAKTIEAYGRDLGQFGRFLQDHLGEPADLKELEGLLAADFGRSWQCDAMTGWGAAALPGSSRRSARSIATSSGEDPAQSGDLGGPLAQAAASRTAAAAAGGNARHGGGTA